MKKLLLLCSLFVGTSALVSCSSSDDDSSGGDPVANSITLTADVTSIEMGSSVNLTVMNDLDENVTGTSTYYANGAVISQVFTPTAAGSYTIHAENGSLVSNTVTVTVIAVQQDNAIFYNEMNYELANSVLVYYGAVDASDDGIDENTHGLWALVAGNGDFQTTESTNYIQFILLTDLDTEGLPLFPSSEASTYYYSLAYLALDGVDIVTEFGHEADPAFAINADFSETADFSYSASVDGTPIALDYATTYLGYIDQSTSGRPAAVTPISEVNTKIDPILLNALLK
ncbi:hypothetical protein [Mangrovimonas sp. DI 80]|uniref:hypothetical protein n=1 Tax=Mangrovimonas sp. DI 80 TaxID=1779330 RepID=UPI000977A312|nr:hypothetical protein [Mangrovimonas sp. DI 80]OMP30594.1 hypothetical protein BKM32_10120 [Mangrovimonas sp. DI 80]